MHSKFGEDPHMDEMAQCPHPVADYMLYYITSATSHFGRLSFQAAKTWDWSAHYSFDLPAVLDNNLSCALH